MLPDIIEACDEIVTFDNKKDLLKAKIGRRQVGYNSEIYEGYSNMLYEKVKSESYRELTKLQYIFWDSFHPLKIMKEHQTL